MSKRLAKLVARAAQETGDPTGAVRWALREGFARLLEARGYVEEGAEYDELAELPWDGCREIFAQPDVEPLDENGTVLGDEWGEALSAAWADVPFDAKFEDGALLGDLYQQLDAAAVKRFAFCQTPAFVANFLAEETVGNAARVWPYEARVLDPACGTGHLLIPSLHRLARDVLDREGFSLDADPEVAAHVYLEIVRDRLVGIDLNPYAAAIARFRLVLACMEAARVRGMAHAAVVATEVFHADALDRCERDAPPNARTVASDVDRSRLGQMFRDGFHAVIGNPPYIVEPDKKKKAYDREQYASAYMRYGLGPVFAERAFDLLVPGGFLGFLTSNAFMKREYGKPHIEKVLPREDLYAIIDCAGAYIPGHGTPTVILFARHQAPTSEHVYAILGKRGEPSTPADPATGLVWQSIEQAWAKYVAARRWVEAPATVTPEAPAAESTEPETPEAEEPPKLGQLSLFGEEAA